MKWINANKQLPKVSTATQGYEVLVMTDEGEPHIGRYLDGCGWQTKGLVGGYRDDIAWWAEIESPIEAKCGGKKK